MTMTKIATTPMMMTMRNGADDDDNDYDVDDNDDDVVDNDDNPVDES